MSENKQIGDLYRVKLKEGAHLAESKNTPGAFRGTQLSNSNNQLAGQAEFIKVDESELFPSDYVTPNEYQNTGTELESSENQEYQKILAELAVAATILLVAKGIEVAIPHIKSWWRKKKSQKNTDKSNKKRRSHTSDITTTNIEPQEDITSIPVFDEAFKKHVNELTSEEAQRELLDMMILYSIFDAKFQKLANSRIKKDGGSPADYIEGEEIIEKLNSPEFVNNINKVLANNPYLLKEQAEWLSMILGRSLIKNGHYLPIEHNEIKEALATKKDDKNHN